MQIDQEMFLLFFKLVNAGIIAVLFRNLFVKYAKPALYDYQEEEARVVQRYVEEKKHLDVRQASLDNQAEEQTMQARLMTDRIEQWRVVIAQQQHEREVHKEAVRRELVEKQTERSRLLQVEHVRRDIMPEALDTAQRTLIKAFQEPEEQRRYMHLIEQNLKERV